MNVLVSYVRFIWIRSTAIIFFNSFSAGVDFKFRRKNLTSKDIVR